MVTNRGGEELGIGRRGTREQGRTSYEQGRRKRGRDWGLGETSGAVFISHRAFHQADLAIGQSHVG